MQKKPTGKLGSKGERDEGGSGGNEKEKTQRQVDEVQKVFRWVKGIRVAKDEGSNYPLYNILPLDIEHTCDWLKNIGCSRGGIDIMKDKMLHQVIKIPDVSFREALILKQDLLSIGGEAAIPENTLRELDGHGDVIISGTHSQLHRLKKKMQKQPFRLPRIGHSIGQLLEQEKGGAQRIFRARDHSFTYPPTSIMGILNVTPDSFSDGGNFVDVERAVDRGIKMVEEGAQIIDIGGESSRPFSSPVSASEELNRIMPVLEELINKVEVPISVDTYKSNVAQEVLEAGAHIINDIYAMRWDGDMAEVVGQYNAGLILMHMKGTPANMQESPIYDDVIKEVFLFLKERTKTAIGAGVQPDHIMIDPGIGFGKRMEDNIQLLRHTSAFSSLGFPVLVGASNKGFVGEITGKPVHQRTCANVGAGVYCALNGADVLRVHDVDQVNDGLKIALGIQKL